MTRSPRSLVLLLLPAFLLWFVFMLGPALWGISITFTNKALTGGWSMMLFEGALANIPREIEESAQVDGASGWQRLRYVTLPLLRGPILVNVILITIWTYGVLGLPLMLTGGGPGHRSELMTLYAYRLGLESFDLSYGTTVSVGILLVSLILLDHAELSPICMGIFRASLEATSTSEASVDYGVMTAVSLVYMIPPTIVFFFTHRYLVSGMLLGAVKQ